MEDELVKEFMNNATYNMLVNLKKQNLNPITRAYIIRKYIEDNNLSIRKLADEIGVPRSTIEDWLLWERVTKGKYEEMMKQGISHTEIYRTLRENKPERKEHKTERAEEIENIETLTINNRIENDINKYKGLIENGIVKDKNTDKLLKKLIEILETIRD